MTTKVPLMKGETLLGWSCIYKYRLAGDLDQTFYFDMPKGARVIHLAVQGEVPTLWAKFDAVNKDQTERRAFRIVGTGHSFSDAWVHVGTWLDGEFVWHLMEVAP